MQTKKRYQWTAVAILAALIFSGCADGKKPSRPPEEFTFRLLPGSSLEWNLIATIKEGNAKLSEILETGSIDEKGWADRMHGTYLGKNPILTVDGETFEGIKAVSGKFSQLFKAGKKIVVLPRVVVTLEYLPHGSEKFDELNVDRERDTEIDIIAHVMTHLAGSMLTIEGEFRHRTTCDPEF